MAMALINGRVATEKVKVLFAIHIPNVYTLAAAQYHGQGMIVVGLAQSASNAFAITGIWCLSGGLDAGLAMAMVTTAMASIGSRAS